MAVRIKTERAFAFVQYKDTAIGSQSIQDLFSLKEISLNWKQTPIPHGQLFQLSMNLREWSVSRRSTSGKHETSLFLPTSNHPDSGRLTGQDHFMNQEWYCTRKAIAQIMIVFTILVCDELKTQI